MIKAGDKVTIKPDFQDAGDSAFDWIAVDDEGNGRVSIKPTNTGLAFPPVNVVRVDMLEPARGYATEFPDFPAEAMPPIPEGFGDASWRNDLCPCFQHEGSGVVLWVDYPKGMQEDDGSARFNVVRCTMVDPVGGWQYCGDVVELLASDDWEEVARALPTFTGQQLEKEKCEDEFTRETVDGLTDGMALPVAMRVARFRLGQATIDDARAMLAEEEASANPCPDLMARLVEIIGKGAQ
ncbi:hypothetical protein I5E68_09720 [Novosphingobium sp. YJ-S2-02]|uniref:Uncharacterized protein n=1 Tax=Novosphingobium aureum TaxID=2792964 RepID=A0A931HD05_9SPHN|nr:hypothetical protein [Novosphingobium aureum]MBH0113223.1 hypothetical protein [Novosphingobium aureum]